MMGDNQSDNSFEWGNPLIYNKEKIKMGHYDLDYEYDDDKKRLSKKDFNKKWDTKHRSSQAKNFKFPENNVSNILKIEYDIKNVSNVKLFVNENGKSEIVISINKMPTYSIKLNTEESNALLIQILKNINE